MSVMTALAAFAMPLPASANEISAISDAGDTAPSNTPDQAQDAPSDWDFLEAFQYQISYADFRWLLETRYAPAGAGNDLIRITRSAAYIRRSASEPAAGEAILYFEAPEPIEFPKEIPTAQIDASALPLDGLHIALDPGHIGGEFGPMEGRSWQVDDGPAIQEGDIVLTIAKRLKPRIEALGATVSLLREAAEPVTHKRPADFLAQATTWAEQTPLAEEHPDEKARRIQRHANRLFYRSAEIYARSLIVAQLQPDLVVALHINGTGWEFDAEGNKQLREQNHLHVLVNGAYLPDEVANDIQRRDMLWRMLSIDSVAEMHMASAFARSFARHSQLPPFVYSGSNAVRINENPYLYARNLLANRIYAAPVVFLEPYVANSKETYPRLVDALQNPDTSEFIAEYINATIDALLASHQYLRN